LFVGVAVAACGGSTSGSGSSACDHYYDALTSSRCGYNGLVPPDRVEQERGRFDQLCAKLVTLPGTGVTAGWIDACASATESTPCRSSQTPSACLGPPAGTLPAGSVCADGSQCQSNSCDMSQPVIGDGGAAEPGCGKCAPGSGGIRCGNSTCLQNELCQNGVCVSPTYAGAGAACGTPMQQCMNGLYCPAQTKMCTALVGSGGACVTSNDCQWPLVCVGTMAQGATCQTGKNAGDACGINGGADCAPTLVCDMTGHCSTIQFAQPGQPCGGMTSTACELGMCTNGMCPTVVQDGQSCGGQGTTCDVFATCLQGTCQVQGTASCQ
jgi:hypothetical protein